MAAESGEGVLEAGGAKRPQELSDSERQQVQKLQARDREVRAHEQAHVAALGGGSASFTYTTGPDGRRYATGGEVPVSIPKSTGDPRTTIAEAQRVARAATAPARPSAADTRARAQALRVEQEARRKLREEREGGEEGGPPTPADAAAGSAGSVGLIESAAVQLENRGHGHPPGVTCPLCQ